MTQMLQVIGFYIGAKDVEDTGYEYALCHRGFEKERTVSMRAY